MLSPPIEPEQSTSSLSAMRSRGVVRGGCKAAIITTGAACGTVSRA